jgi:putative RNA 2'-phosphotransferase
MTEAQVRTSKFISLVLRHKPEEAGLTLDESGWCRVADLLRGCAANKHRIDREDLEAIVADNDKKRFQFSDDGERIRAVQGHSIIVDLKYDATEPPTHLFHGTATRFLDSIKASGLVKGSRQHVHLSAKRDTAMQVGARHGKPVVLIVFAGEMHRDGYTFYNAPNGVWLVDAVPSEYLRFNELIYE